VLNNNPPNFQHANSTFGPCSNSDLVEEFYPRTTWSNYFGIARLFAATLELALR
jgi:hypothetical protein